MSPCCILFSALLSLYWAFKWKHILWRTPKRAKDRELCRGRPQDQKLISVSGGSGKGCEELWAFSFILALWTSVNCWQTCDIGNIQEAEGMSVYVWMAPYPLSFHHSIASSFSLKTAISTFVDNFEILEGRTMMDGNVDAWTFGEHSFHIVVVPAASLALSG